MHLSLISDLYIADQLLSHGYNIFQSIFWFGEAGSGCLTCERGGPKPSRAHNLVWYLFLFARPLGTGSSTEAIGRWPMLPRVQHQRPILVGIGPAIVISNIHSVWRENISLLHVSLTTYAIKVLTLLAEIAIAPLPDIPAYIFLIFVWCNCQG